MRHDPGIAASPRCEIDFEVESGQRPFRLLAYRSAEDRARHVVLQLGKWSAKGFFVVGAELVRSRLLKVITASALGDRAWSQSSAGWSN